MFVHPHKFIHPSGGANNPHVPVLYASVCSGKHLHVVGGPFHLEHLPYMLDTSPIWGCLPICLTPPLIGWLPCASVCLGDICMLYGEYSPYIGVGSVPHMFWAWGASAHLSSFGAWQYIHWVSIMLYFVPYFCSLCLTYLPQL